jgi:cellulose synthase/poly-beta-1,6-N-acetylglucosamine synthase-like glycosyltransferase
MQFFIEIILWIIWLILFLNVAYMFFYAIAGLFYKKTEFTAVDKKLKFAVFIPAYKGDEVILNTTAKTLLQNYPAQKFEIIVIADSLKEATVAELKRMPIKVVEVKFDNSTKGKSLNMAIKAVENERYDYAVILDIDNIIETLFLEKMNSALQNGQKVLQAHRLAKNEDTNFSILDAISEEINNHIFRKGHKVLGLSAALIGSGKAISYPYFVEIMSKITAVGGFDKQMEILIISRGDKIDYEHGILVYDEKVQLPEIFQNQRKRWMSAQLTFMRQYALKGIFDSIRTFNFDYFDKCLQLLLLPRLICLGATFFFSLVWFTNIYLGNLFLVIFILELIALTISTPKRFANAETFKALMQLPYGFILMVLNLFKLRGADKKFIHTPIIL